MPRRSANEMSLLSLQYQQHVRRPQAGRAESRKCFFKRKYLWYTAVKLLMVEEAP